VQLEALNIFVSIGDSAAIFLNASTVPTQFNVFQNEAPFDEK
jgi:hypothetical protein